MNPDIALVVGMAVIVLSIPAIVSAVTDGRAPRAAAIAVMVGGGLVVLALNTKPGGYTIAEIPNTIARVVGMLLN
jgi:hypothetical protein